MLKMIWTSARGLTSAAALIAISAGVADAAPARVGNNTNLRGGPGIQFGVIATAPAGSVVNVIRCGIEWCNVTFGGRPGYMVGRNLGIAPRQTVVRPGPQVVVVEPPIVVPGPYYYGGYYGPGYYGGGYYRGGYYGRGWGGRRRW